MKTLVIAYFAAAVLAAPALIWADEAPPSDPATATPAQAPAEAPAPAEATPAAVVPVAPGPAEEDFAKADEAVSSTATDEVVKTTDVKPERKPKPKARAAGTKSVTIKDFEFGPKSVTVSKGDTVTWTNQDSAPHTATGTGSDKFDTGNLKKGQSGSQKFTKTGSFAYICAIHPNMKGTVVVKASSSGSGGSDSGSSGSSGSGSSDSGSSDSGSSSSDDAFQLSDDSSSSDSSNSSSSDDQSLASTGGNIGLTLLLGLGLVGAGAVMRRRTLEL